MDRLIRILWAGCAVGLALALSGTLEPANAPRSLDAALGRPTDPAAARAMERRAEEAVEALTLACMRAASLAYTAFVDRPPIPDQDLGPLEWAERWGFGVSTSVNAASPPARIDPMMERLAGLGPEERQRYLAALDGPPDPGCRPAASQAVHGLRVRLEEPLRPALAALRDAIAAHPDANAANGRWRRCLAEAGITVTDRRGTVPRVIAALAERVARLRVGDRTALRALQAEERALAVAVARCEVALDEALRRVSAPLERRFVEDHASALAAIRRAIDQAEASWPTLSSP